jgi:DMSO/TMAO reductase YedYZ heme-binding membrane subunit
MKLPDLRYRVWAIGLALTAALPVLAGFTTLGWEVSEIAGLVGAVVCLALCGCPVRPRNGTPPVLLSLGRHAVLGWIALGAAGVHVLVALLSDHRVVDYLKTTAPLYQLMGIAALLVLALLTVTSVAGVRRRLWRSHRTFQATHIVQGCVLVVLLGAHVITTDRYTGGYVRRGLYLAAAAGGIAMLLRRRRQPSTAPRELAVTPRPATAPRDLAVTPRLAFGRHSTLIVGVIVAAMLCLSALVPGRARVALREPLRARNQAPPLNFDHRKHTAVNCLTCHHNYADGRGFDACIYCHRSARPALKVGAEARFHEFCLDCHRHPRADLPRHGPVSGCTTCHQPPAA